MATPYSLRRPSSHWPPLPASGAMIEVPTPAARVRRAKSSAPLRPPLSQSANWLRKMLASNSGALR